MKSRIADNIMQEYERKKRRERKKRFLELQLFIKENCINCKNKKTNLCHISRNNENKLQCVFKKF